MSQSKQNNLNARVQGAGRAIGAILIDTGRLNPEDAERILHLQTQENLRFGEAAIRLGLLTESDILYALSVQFNHPILPGNTRQLLSEELVAAYRPFSKEGEHIRILRSQLQMRWFDSKENKSVLAIVSPEKREGRSYLAANLAIAFAQAGERTLLIDGDMRNPSQHILFGLDNAQGLSRLLSGRMDDRVVNFIPGLPGLGVLTAGPIPPNSIELLGRHGFEAILEKSKSSFDAVIIDTPALSWGPDAELLSRFAGAAVMVAKTHGTQTQALHDGIARLRGNGTHILGSVLIDSPVGQSTLSRKLRRR